MTTALAETSRAIIAGIGKFEVGPSTVMYDREGNDIAVTHLITKSGHMGKGYARAAMQIFLRACDKEQLSVYLTPVVTEPGRMEKSRLVAFYKSLGFKNNRQRKKDYWAHSGMLHYYKMVRPISQCND